MLRWLDREVPNPVKLGDLNQHYETLKARFPFDQLLLDAKTKPVEVKKFVHYCFRNLFIMSTEQKTMAFLIADFSLQAENDKELAAMISRAYFKHSTDEVISNIKEILEQRWKDN